MKNRDIVNHDGAGKGDANRSPLNDKWRENYDAIQWVRPGYVRNPHYFQKRGGKLVKKYRS